jgi:hypothetical protein
MYKAASFTLRCAVVTIISMFWSIVGGFTTGRRFRYETFHDLFYNEIIFYFCGIFVYGLFCLIISYIIKLNQIKFWFRFGFISFVTVNFFVLIIEFWFVHNFDRHWFILLLSILYSGSSIFIGLSLERMSHRRT